MMILVLLFPFFAQADTHSLVVTFQDRSFHISQTSKLLEVRGDYRIEKLSLEKCDRKKKTESLWRDLKKSLAAVSPLEKIARKGVDTVAYELDGKKGKILPYGKQGVKLRAMDRKVADFIIFAEMECKK